MYSLSWLLIYYKVGFFLWVSISNFFRLSSILGNSTFYLYYYSINTWRGLAFLNYLKNYLNFSLDFCLSSSIFLRLSIFFRISCLSSYLFSFSRLLRNYYSNAAFSAFFIYWYRLISSIFYLNRLKSSLISLTLAFPLSDLGLLWGSISYMSLTSSCTYNVSTSSSLILLNLFPMISYISSDIF